MAINPRKFFKPQIDNGRERIDFSSIIEHCPDLGSRVIVIRSRVFDLNRKFQSDSDWALRNYNLVTTATIAAATFAIALGVAVSIFYPSAALAAVASVGIGAIVGVAGAASKAFGWHKRYSAMFRARWAMVSLEIQIDDLLCNLALDVEEGVSLSESNRVILREAADRWLSQIDSTLKTFGENYGAAIEPIEIKSGP